MHPPSLHLTYFCSEVFYLYKYHALTHVGPLASMQCIQWSYLLTYLLISVWTQDYLFYLGNSYNPALSSFILLLALSQHWPSRVSSSCPYVAASIWFFFFSTSLPFGSTRCLGSSWSPSLESIPIPRSPVSSLGEEYLRAGCSQC